ncbi:capsular polysaccharide biosynthesis protein [Pelistega ratti]|uniref:capsular polysaccharide biosynthesis protein n=1 Tax=Pelistega ratti TaxID=2652177 RepID=UPI00135B8D85|nr:capsular polysaccharide biosynthesis protein [Pelistega ratti]
MIWASLGLWQQRISLDSFLDDSEKTTGNLLLWGRKHERRQKILSVFADNPLYIEDGFLRSLGLGVQGYPPFSIVLDKVGVYYDTTCPSQLEQLILATETLNEVQQREATRALSLIKTHHLSKYNHAPDLVEIPDTPVVLVIDQTFGDMAVKYAQADASHFIQMLDCAVAENPHATIWIKTHPDVISGKKKGYLTELTQHYPTVRVFAQDVNPLSLLNIAEKVYCVSSHMGFEALLLNKTVITFGVPWFSGWGVTEERHPQAQTLAKSNRRKERSILQLFYTAYFTYSRYIDPNTGKKGTIFDVIDYLVTAKQQNTYLSGDLYCIGMSLWKRAVITPFFQLPNCRLHFVPHLSQLQKVLRSQSSLQVKILVWGERSEEVLAFAQQYQIPILRIEDGFIRSVGLGSNLVAPISVVVDDRGIYFNAQQSSRLEHILQHQSFSQADVIRAEQLRQRLIQSHIGKYNVGSSDFVVQSGSKPVLLVVGQVEDDASIQLGSPYIRDNLSLLKRVRDKNPHAYIIYKPHPDVVSGNRKGVIAKEQVMKLADEIVTTVNILDCIQQVDEVHTMTSLAGFEALLRGKKVYCYGLPFYAGWGLTVDCLAVVRRNRQLNLHELIAGVLMYYPLYFDPKQKRLVNVERAIEYLNQQKMEQGTATVYRPWLLKQWEKVKQLWKALG